MTAPTIILTVDELVTEVRDKLDEDNTSDVTTAQILRALNRAQQKLVRIATKRYEPMFRGEETLTPNSGGADVTIPESAYGLIVDHAQAVVGNSRTDVEIVSLRDLVNWESSTTQTTVPAYAAQHGNKLKLYPKAASGTSLVVRYQVRPPKLVQLQGRITSIDSDNGILTLDALGSELTTSIADLKAFVNVVDSTTGLLKGTYQVNELDTDEVTLTIKTSSLSRSTVFGNTVATALDSTITEDDYVCIANGTCVPKLVGDYSDYLIQYAVVELKRSREIPVNEDYGALKELEQDIKNLWAGRAGTMRIQRKNPYWAQRISYQSLFR